MYEEIPYGGKEIEVDKHSDTLLVMFHGFTARPQVLLPLIDHLKQECDFDILAPVIDGFGGSVEQFCRSGLRKWLRCVDRVVGNALLKYDKVFIFGHSLGGLFALYSALKHDSVKGVITFATPYELTDKEENKRILDNIVDHDGYFLGKRLSWGMTTPRPNKKSARIQLKGLNLFVLRNRLRGKLPKIRQNVLNIHSRNDEISSFVSQSKFGELIASDHFQTLCLDKSMHTFFNKDEIEVICSAILDFVKVNS